jgi:hypothetical protein
MPAPDLYTAPPPNEYLILQPRLTNQGLLKVFYAHVLELARLVQATEVPLDLDPANIARGEDRWSWSVSLPMQVEKLWADLQAVRKQVARALAANARAQAERAQGRQAADVRDEGAQPADRDLVKGCMHLYYTMDAVVRHVAPQLAASFVDRLLEIADRLPARFGVRFGVLSRRPAMAAEIRLAWRAGEYHRALATYLKAQISEELAALVAPRARL